MSFENPSLETKMDELTKALCWASKSSPVVWGLQDTERFREANNSWIELHLLRIASEGVDENRYEDVGGDEPMAVTQFGQRVFTIQVDCRSRNNNHSFAAWNLAETTRTRMSSTFVANSWLHDNCLSLLDTTDIINAPTGVIFDNRAESKSLFELSLLTVVTESDLAYAGSFIEQIEVTSKFKLPDGNPLDDSLQLDEKVLP